MGADAAATDAARTVAAVASFVPDEAISATAALADAATRFFL